MLIGKNKNRLEGASGGIILIGIGVIFLLNISFFPAILVVLGLAGLPGSLANKGFWAGIQGAVWLIGLAILFATGRIWPGILILIGLSMIGGSLVRPPMLEKEKRKRGLPVPPADALEDDEADSLASLVAADEDRPAGRAGQVVDQ